MRNANDGGTAVLPLGIKDRVKTELPALVALSAIGEAWFSGEHQADLMAVALVVRELATTDSLQAQCSAELQRLCEQPITVAMKRDIALNLAECLPWLQLQRNSRVQYALNAVVARASGGRIGSSTHRRKGFARTGMAAMASPAAGVGKAPARLLVADAAGT